MLSFYIFLFHYFVAGQDKPKLHKHEASRYAIGLLDDLNKGVPKWITTKGDCTPSGAWPDWDKSCTLTLTDEAPNPGTNHVQSAYVDQSVWDKKKQVYQTSIKFDRGIIAYHDLFLQGVIGENCVTCKSKCTDCASFTSDGKCFLADPTDPTFTEKDKQYVYPNHCPDNCKPVGDKFPWLLDWDERSAYVCSDTGSPVTAIRDSKHSDAWEIQWIYSKTLNFDAAKRRKFRYHPLDCQLHPELPDKFCWTKMTTTPSSKSVQGISFVAMIRHRDTGKYLTTDGKGGLVLKSATKDDFPVAKDGLKKMNHNSFTWVFQYYNSRFAYTWGEMLMIAVEVPMTVGGVGLCLADVAACVGVVKAMEGAETVAAGVEAGEAVAGTRAAVTSARRMSEMTIDSTTSASSLYDPAATWLVKACKSAVEKNKFAQKVKWLFNTMQGASIGIWGTKYRIRYFKAMASIALFALSSTDIYFNRVADATRRRLGIEDPQMPQRTPMLSIAHLPDDAYQAALWPGSCFERPEMMMSYAECLAGAGGFDSELCGRVGGKVDGLHWVDIGKAGEEYCEIRKRIREGFTVDDYSEAIYPSSIMKMMSSTDTEEPNAEFQEHHPDSETLAACATDGDCGKGSYCYRAGQPEASCVLNGDVGAEASVMNAAEKRESYVEYALGNNYAIQAFAFLGFCSTIFFIYQLTMKNNAPYEGIVEAEI